MLQSKVGYSKEGAYSSMHVAAFHSRVENIEVEVAMRAKFVVVFIGMQGIVFFLVYNGSTRLGMSPPRLSWTLHCRCSFHDNFYHTFKFTTTV